MKTSGPQSLQSLSLQVASELGSGLILSSLGCRWCSPHSFWSSDPCWRCMQISWHTQTCCWLSLQGPHQRRGSFASWSIISLPSMRAARGPWPRSPTTPSLGRHFIAHGKYPRIGSGQRGLLPTHLLAMNTPWPVTPPKATNYGLWRSKCPITRPSPVSTVSARKRDCVSTLMYGPKASSWACPLGCQ